MQTLLANPPIKEDAVIKFRVADHGKRLFVTAPRELMDALGTPPDANEFEYTHSADAKSLALWNALTELRDAWLQVVQARELEMIGQKCLFNLHDQGDADASC